MQDLCTHCSFVLWPSFYKIFSRPVPYWGSGLSSNVTPEKGLPSLYYLKSHTLLTLTFISFSLLSEMTLFICYLIIICFSLFECKLYVNRNIKAPCRALWMDSQLSENDAFCKGVCRSIVKTGVDFTIWREIARMQDAMYFDTAVYWVKFFFFPSFPPHLDTW